MRTVASYMAMLTLMGMLLLPSSQASLLSVNEENETDRSFSYFGSMLQQADLLDQSQYRLSQVLPKTTVETLHRLNPPLFLDAENALELDKVRDELSIKFMQADALEAPPGGYELNVPIIQPLILEYQPIEQMDIPIIQPMVLAAQPNEQEGYVEVSDEVNAPIIFFGAPGAQPGEIMDALINRNESLGQLFFPQDEMSGGAGMGDSLRKRVALDILNNFDSLGVAMMELLNTANPSAKLFISGGYASNDRSFQPLYGVSSFFWSPRDIFEPESYSYLSSGLISQINEMIIPASSTLAETVPAKNTDDSGHTLFMSYLSAVSIQILFLLLILL